MRTLKVLIILMLVSMSLEACGSSKKVSVYTLNPAKTFVLIKSYRCEDVMNDSFVPLEDYLSQPPVLCGFSTLELGVTLPEIDLHAVYKEPAYFTIKDSADEDVEIFADSITELQIKSTLTMPSTLTKGQAAPIKLNATGSAIYDKTGRKISYGIGLAMVIRPMTVVQSAFESAFENPWDTVDAEFDAQANPWEIRPQGSDFINNLDANMTLTVPESVNSKTIALIVRLTQSHFEYLIFVYYEAKS